MQTIALPILSKLQSLEHRGWQISSQRSVNIYVVIVSCLNSYELIIYDEFNEKTLCCYSKTATLAAAMNYYDELIRIADAYYV